MPALLMRQRLFAAEVEVTAGTAETLANADAAMNCYDVEIQPAIDAVRREGQSSLSPLPSITGRRASRVSLMTDLSGKGASGNPLWATTLLASAGFAATGATFAPSTGSNTTVTCGKYLAGLRYLSVGTCFDLEIALRTGEFGKCSWTGQGAWGGAADATMLTPTYPTVKPPRFASATFTIGGTAFKVSAVTIRLNNELYLREDPTTATGLLAAQVVNRNITVEVDPEGTLLATKDWYADHLAHTEVAMSCVIGSDANNTITIAAPKLQIVEAPQVVDRGGIVAKRLMFQANRSASAGDDELTIAFS